MEKMFEIRTAGDLSAGSSVEMTQPTTPGSLMYGNR